MKKKHEKSNNKKGHFFWPRVYERGIFGDLMLPGIACGIKKILLIFNTNINTPHDPIYIIDPSTFNVQPDTDIPNILAYNMSHYESIEPCTNEDIDGTIKLVREYKDGTYKYGKKDIPYLLAPLNTPLQKNTRENASNTKKTRPEGQNRAEVPQHVKKTQNNNYENIFTSKRRKQESTHLAKSKGNSDETIDTDIDLEEIDDILDHQSKLKQPSSHVGIDLYYKLKNKPENHAIKENAGKLECPLCKLLIKNVLLHFERKDACGKQIDMIHFSQEYARYKKDKDRKRNRENKQKSNQKQKQADPEGFKKRNLEAVKKSQNKQKQEDPTGFNKRNLEAAKKSQNKQKQKDPTSFNKRNLEATKKEQNKKKTNIDDRERIFKFKAATLIGPIFICSCCKRRMYEHSVVKITDDLITKIDRKGNGLYRKAIKSEEIIKLTINGSNDKTGAYICTTCRNTMMACKVPSMAEENGLKLTNIQGNCHLTEFENNLIAQNLNFQYIYCLKKSRMAASKNQMISVPVHPETVLKTVSQLPRLPKDGGLVTVNLKRKKTFKNHHKKELVNPIKVIMALKLLKRYGHPYYQFITDLNSYKTRCEEQDQEGHQLLFGSDNSGDETSDDESSSDKADEDEIDQKEKDTIKKFQFDHNRNTCLTSNYPEAEVDDNGKRATFQEELSFAPAEGNYPTNILEEKDWDIKSWPMLHPDGKFGIHHKRKVRLTDQQYLGQRILNKDLRFSQSAGYIFAAAAYIEKKQLMSKANISFMRGKKSLGNEGKAQYDLEDAFTTFEGVTNTPKYWQKVKYDMIAKLENIGPFHIFFTLSCGDARYDENFSTILEQMGYEIHYTRDRANKNTETIVVNKDDRKIQKPLEAFLREDIDDSLHEMIRTNVLTATRNFQRRVETFEKEIMMGENNPMKIKYISYRVEFQGRGAAHIHGTLWLDLKEIEKHQTFQSIGEGILSEAFRKLRDDIKLSDKEKTAIERFTDLFCTCTLNPNTVHRDTEVGKKIIEIIKKVNCHHCTGPCEKYGDKCKYGFPRYPLKETLVIDRHEFDDLSEKELKEKASHNTRYRKILSDIEEVLGDEDTIKEIMSKYEKGATEEEYSRNRAKRIDLLLERAGNIDYDDYIMAIKTARKYGSTVLLKRDLDEIYVNNYNPEWAEAWNANHDIQPALDYFAVITYITDYWAKPDEGITQHLKEAAAILKNEKDKKKKMPTNCKHFHDPQTNERSGGTLQDLSKPYIEVLKYGHRLHSIRQERNEKQVLDENR